LLRQYAATHYVIPSDDEVIETLLAASKFGPLTRRRHILSVVDRLLSDSTSIDLWAETVYQRSVVLRLMGDITGSNRVLRGFLESADMCHRLHSNFNLGLLYLSKAMNHAYKFDFSLAEMEAKKWVPTEATEKQTDIAWHQIHLAGRVSRGRGSFKAACDFFERCLQLEPPQESKRILATANLADTYIELDYMRCCEAGSHNTREYLDIAESIVRPEIEHIRSKLSSKGLRRLLLSLSEIELRRGRFDRAECLLMELCNIYADLHDPDIVDRLGHVRAFIGLARISPLSEAENRWTNALNLGRMYNPLEEEVFTVALIHLFICKIRLQHEDSEGGKAAFEYAKEICRRKSRQFLIPGVGTYLFDDVRYQIELLAGWKLPGNDSCIL
jgi:hypothetical protein